MKISGGVTTTRCTLNLVFASPTKRISNFSVESPKNSIFDGSVSPKWVKNNYKENHLLFLSRGNLREGDMSKECLIPPKEATSSFRLCNVSGYTVEILELQADDPKLHVLFIPGNPGVVLFYKDFLESLFQALGGAASITAVGHTGHTKKNWDHERLFSLQDQIDHKVEFIRQEFLSLDIPVVLVGHSIGAHIAIETFKRSEEKVIFCASLYPFLKFYPQMPYQNIIQKISESSVLTTAVTYLIVFLGLLPKLARLIVLNSLGRSWSSGAVDVLCSHLLQNHILRNILFMTKTEFRELVVELDWAFMREKKDKLAFIYGVDDHWGPLEMFNEISKQVPGVALSVEREGHGHNFSCTKAGSTWVAQNVAALIKSEVSSPGY